MKFHQMKTNSPQCSEDLVNIEEAVKQGQLLQEAFVCGKPEARNIILNAKHTRTLTESPLVNSYSSWWHEQTQLISPFQLDVRVFHSPSFTLPKISWFCANVWKMYMGWHPASITYLHIKILYTFSTRSKTLGSYHIALFVWLSI